MSDRLVIDAHMHVYRTKEDNARDKGGYDVWEYGSADITYSAASGEPEDARRALAEAGASLAIVANIIGTADPSLDPAEDVNAFDRWLCELAKQDSRFIPFISVDHRWLSVPEQLSTLRALTEQAGARGLKIHPPIQGLDLTNPATWELFDACCSLGIAVMSHSGPTQAGRGRGEPDHFRALLERFPELRLSLAHLGGAAWHQASALARDFPSVYFDCSEIIEWIGAPNAPTPREFVRLVREIGVNRVMMGSDYPWYEPAHTVARIDELAFSDAEKAEILGGNASRFLRI